MKNKFNLTREQNVFIVKRNIVDYIWKIANLEGIEISYPQTQVFLYTGLLIYYKLYHYQTLLRLQ